MIGNKHGAEAAEAERLGRRAFHTAAKQLGNHWFIAALLGVTTGVFGGVMRDIICNEVPYVFQRTELYATCSFIGAWCYLGVAHGGEVGS